MSKSENHAAGPYEQGFSWRGDDEAVLRDVVEAAFDYRGDVTLHLRPSGEITGFLFNRDARAAGPYVEIFPSDGGDRKRLTFDAIEGVTFSGRDMARGKSWADWTKKWKAKQAAEARGETVGDISLYPDEA